LCIIYVQLASTLPKISPEDVFSNSSQMNKLFNRHFLWDFEGMQMLIGTDLPIFRNSNNSSLSSRLRYNIFLLIHFMIFRN